MHKIKSLCIDHVKKVLFGDGSMQFNVSSASVVVVVVYIIMCIHMRLNELYIIHQWATIELKLGIYTLYI